MRNPAAIGREVPAVRRGYATAADPIPTGWRDVYDKCHKRVRRQPSAITALVWWRRWESKTSDFAPNQATTGNHGKPDPDLAETKDSKKHVRENALPTGKIEAATTEGRADVGDVPTAETLGTLARTLL